MGERLPQRALYRAHSTRLQTFRITWQACEFLPRGWGVATSWPRMIGGSTPGWGCRGVSADMSFLIPAVVSEALASRLAWLGWSN